jgi:hypothetical protein
VVRAVPERHVTVWLTGNVEPVRIAYQGGVAVRRRQRDQHHLSRTNHLACQRHLNRGGLLLTGSSTPPAPSIPIAATSQSAELGAQTATQSLI